jgi:probable blue pigment (indigoidine) exporter
MDACPSTVGDMTLTAPTTTTIGSDRVGLTAVTALTPVVWGTTYLTTTELLPPGHPAFAAAMRAVPAGLLALLVARQLPQGIWWFRSLVIGTMNIGIFFPLLFVSAERLPGGVAATLGAIQPLVVAGLAIAVLREPASTWRVGWGLAGLAGVALVVLESDAGLDPVGVLAGIAGAASMALGVTLAKRWGRPAGVSAVGFAGWQLTAAGVVLVPLSVLEGPPPDIDAHAVTGYLWLGLVGGLLAYTLWFRGIGRLPVTAVAMLGLLSPIVAAALGAVVLGETFSSMQVAGFAVALTAIVGSQLPEPRTRLDVCASARHINRQGVNP